MQQFGDIEGEAVLVLHAVAAPVEQNLQQPLFVLSRQRMEQVDDLVAARVGEHAHHAEIDYADTVVRQEKHIARMRIGMKEAMHEHHAQYRIRAACRQQARIEAGLDEPGRRNAGHADDFLLNDHMIVAQRPEHPRNLDQRIVGEVTRELVDVARFLGEIELALQRAAKLGHDLHRVVTARIRHLAVQQSGRMVEYAQIRTDHGLDAGAADFHHDRRTVLQPGPVHLRDGGCRDGDTIEARKHRFRLAADGRNQVGMQCFVAYCRYMTVQLLEFADPVRRKHIHPRRQQLAEFHEGRPQFLQRAADTHRRVELRDFVGALPVQHPPGAFQRTAYAQHAHQIAPAVADHDRSDFVQSRQIAHDRERFPEHGSYYGWIGLCGSRTPESLAPSGGSAGTPP